MDSLGAGVVLGGGGGRLKAAPGGRGHAVLVAEDFRERGDVRSLLEEFVKGDLRPRD